MAKALNRNLKSSRQVLANPHNIVEDYSCASSFSICMGSENENCEYSELSMEIAKSQIVIFKNE